MKLSQLSFNFNYQMNKQPKKTENQMRFSSLPKDTISFGVRLPENFRKKVQYESRLKPALSKEKMTNEMYELLLELIALKESYSYKKNIILGDSNEVFIERLKLAKADEQPDNIEYKTVKAMLDFAKANSEIPQLLTSQEGDIPIFSAGEKEAALLLDRSFGDDIIAQQLTRRNKDGELPITCADEKTQLVLLKASPNYEILEEQLLGLGRITDDIVNLIPEEKRAELLNKIESQQRQRAEQLLSEYMQPCEGEVGSSRHLSPGEADLIISYVGQYEDLSKKILDACNPDTLSFSNQQRLMQEILKKHPKFAREFLIDRGFYEVAKTCEMTGDHEKPIVSIINWLTCAPDQETFDKLLEKTNLLIGHPRDEDCIRLFNMAQSDFAIEHLLFKKVGVPQKARREYFDEYCLASKLDNESILNALDRIKGVKCKKEILLASFEKASYTLGEKGHYGHTVMGNILKGNTDRTFPHVFDVMKDAETADADMRKLYSLYFYDKIDEHILYEKLISKLEEDNTSREEAIKICEFMKSRFENETYKAEFEYLSSNL